MYFNHLVYSIRVMITNVAICETLGDLRLVGGENFTEGRLEICYNSTWGTICDNGFGVEDATVACIQLGFSDQGKLSITLYGACCLIHVDPRQTHDLMP